MTDLCGKDWEPIDPSPVKILQGQFQMTVFIEELHRLKHVLGKIHQISIAIR